MEIGYSAKIGFLLGGLSLLWGSQEPGARKRKQRYVFSNISSRIGKEIRKEF